MPAEYTFGSLVGTRTTTGFIGNTDLADTYAFSLSGSQNVSISLTGLSADADLRLFRASTVNGGFEAVGEIAQSRRSESNPDFISQTLMPGLYIVQVEQYLGNTNYSLSLTTNNPSNFYNVNSLTGAQTFSGWVGTGNSRDTYGFSLNATSNLNLSLTGMSYDADLQIGIDRNGNNQIDAGERLVNGLSQRTGSQSEAIDLTGLAAGNYLVEVYQYRGNTHYRLGMNATATNNALSRVDLTGQFSSIAAPDIRLVNEAGQARLLVTNQGTQAMSGPVTVNLYASTNQRYDSNDEWMASRTLTLNLGVGQSQYFDFSFGAPTVVAPGSYYLLARIDANQGIVESNENNNLITQHISAPGTDVVLDWNATLLNAIQDSNVPPPLAARHAAIVQAAVHDAIVAINRQNSPLYVSLNAAVTQGADVRAAAAAAAHTALVTLFPATPDLNLRIEFDAQLTRSLAEVPNGAAENLGIQIGQYVAQQLLASRQFDGSNTPVEVSYIPSNLPGSYQPTNAEGIALLPGWGQVAPFGIINANSFVPNGLPLYGSFQYALELNEVQSLGGRNSTTRTADQTDIATFWAYDRPDTFRPPAQWSQLAQSVSLQAGTSLTTNALMFALMNIAQADAGIVAWQTKYTYNQLRPITAVHQADLDGNSLTTADPNWDSFLSTPWFPDYISGHATFGGAAAAVLAFFYGSNYRFDVTSQEMPGIYRSYTSFRQAADENGASRLYGGVHVRSANEHGVNTGYAVANFILNRYFS